MFNVILFLNFYLRVTIRVRVAERWCLLIRVVVPFQLTSFWYTLSTIDFSHLLFGHRSSATRKIFFYGCLTLHVYAKSQSDNTTCMLCIIYKLKLQYVQE